MHADERNAGMSEALGYDVWHYHLHVVYIPVVEKEIRWTKRCKDPALVGTVKETVTQVSHSKKWASVPALDESGKPLHNKSGKLVLKKSYSVLQDQYHRHMVKAGFTDVERGERGSDEERLTTVQFKVMKETQRLEAVTEKVSAATAELERLEDERAQAEAKLKAAQNKLDDAALKVKDVETFARELGEPEQLLPAASLAETGRAYREKKAHPLVAYLVETIKSLFAKLMQERDKNRKLQRACEREKRRAVVADETVRQAEKFEKLTAVLGSAEIERLLAEHPKRKCEQHKREQLKHQDDAAR